MEWHGHALWVELIVRSRLRALVAREGAILVIAMTAEVILTLFTDLNEGAKGVAVYFELTCDGRLAYRLYGSSYGQSRHMSRGSSSKRR